MKIILSKALVFAVICLFIGASVLPSINGNIEEKEDTEIRDYVDVVSLPPDDELDQFQNEATDGYCMQSRDVWDAILAQSFKPSLNTLTRIEFGYSYNLMDSFDLICKIISELDGEVLTQKQISSNQIPSADELGWIEFDFPDISVIPETTYYIQMEVIGGTMECCITWSDSQYNPYDRGEITFWENQEWHTHPWADFCFRTYGYNADNQAEIVIDSIEGGFRSIAVIKNNGTATATDVDWSIDLEGGLIIAGEHTEGVISELAPGATTTIRQSTLYGIGMTTITVTAGDATKQATAFILGPLVLNVQEL